MTVNILTYKGSIIRQELLKDIH